MFLLSNHLLNFDAIKESKINFYRNNNEMIKIDMLVSSGFGIKPDIERVARAENFIEDKKLDVRRD